MPTRYLPVPELVDRIGEQEAIRLTSETQPPARDDAKIERAIEDSEEEADGYVSRRYAMPLDSIPKVLKTWVAALAREKLHKTRPTPEVKDAADRARAQLREVSTGIFKLFPDAVEEAAIAGDRDPMGSDERPSSFRDSLAGFTLRDGSGAYRGRWRDE